MSVFTIGGFSITQNIFATNSTLGSVAMPSVIMPTTALNQNQYAFMGGVLNSNRLSIGFSGDTLLFNGGYLAGRDLFNYQPAYSNPKLSINFMGKFLGLPQEDLNLLLAEAEKQKGNKVWLKNTLAWIGKNWQFILSGVVTAATLIKESKSVNSEFNTQIGAIPTTTLPTTGGVGEVIIPTITGGVGSIVDTITTNIVPIGLLGVAAYFIFKK